MIDKDRRLRLEPRPPPCVDVTAGRVRISDFISMRSRRREERRRERTQLLQLEYAAGILPQKGGPGLIRQVERDGLLDALFER